MRDVDHSTALLIPVGNAIESLSSLVYLMQRETDIERLRQYISMVDSVVRLLARDVHLAPRASN